MAHPNIAAVFGLKLSLLLACVLLAGSLTTAHAADAVTRRDDAYHFASSGNTQHEASYVEWWYFNLIDRTQGLDLAFTYAILDPANLSAHGAAAVTAIAYQSGAAFTETAVYPPTAFYASHEQADVLIAGGSPLIGNYIQVLSDDVYHVVGSVNQGHRVSWNLVYIRRASPWFASDRQAVGVLPWEHMSWLPYMPGAVVVGDVTVDGRSYHLTGARGYHDHNWGERIPFTVTWNWAQYFEPGLAFSMGDFRNSPAGVLSIDVAGTRTIFTKTQYTVTQGDWAYDAANALWFPAATWISAQNADSALIVQLNAVATVPVRPPPQIPLPLVPVIYEQTARVSGWLWKKDLSGQWRFARAFNGDGFNEYTDISWVR